VTSQTFHQARVSIDYIGDIITCHSIGLCYQNVWET